MSNKASKKSGKSRSARPKPTQRKAVRTAARTPPPPLTKPADTARATPLVGKNKQRSGTKQAGVIAMLRAPGGTTITAMMQATGWQQHSVRGFLAGVVHKKLGLNLMSTLGEGGRVYRIDNRKVNTKTNKAA